MSDPIAGMGLEREELLRMILRERVDLQASLELAEILLARPGGLDEADRLARNVLVQAPRHPHAHRVLGTVFMRAGRAESAEYHFRRIIELVGERAPAAASLAQALAKQGKLDEAEIWFEKATSLDSENSDAWLGWCRLAEARGNIPRAWELLQEAERFGETADTRLVRAILLARDEKFEESVEVLSTGTADGAPPVPRALVERGKQLVHLGRYDEAWGDFAEAKRQLNSTQAWWYDRARATSLAERLAQFFTRQRMEVLPRAEVRTDVPQPLFVLGFPRSGTTLVEQILSSHPAVTAGDELQSLDWVMLVCQRFLGSRYQYPECLGELAVGDNQFMPNLLRDYYLGCAGQIGLLQPGRAYFTDKMPLNETHLGLIQIMFPRSPIVYVRRHPLDVVCSNFETLHHHGFNQAFDAETSAEHYVLIDSLVTHYREQFDLRFLELRYEDLVADPEAEIRRLLDFIGVEFDPRCLAFHENERVSRTGSYVQVTEKLYDRSVYRYRNYRQYLDPAVAVLQPVLERLGYPSD